MVKRKKHDKDKYYNLARQQGYRARSAFKLIQLNKKYDFLSSAKVCIDLCAAPGGWCQVAAKYMPVSSIILGIDLLPIRPIRNVKTFQCDITTQKCRSIIKQELQTWSADVVLCDGAPNVGAEYSKDAYVQNELALIALKLAVDVMGRGGTFVTKVFRSQDYNALLWVFKQLFKTVSATKPLSSRNESAEIFVVCEHYLAPNSIDPKLLDPKHVFSQIETEENGITIFHPKYGVRKRHRQGYDEKLGVTLTNATSVNAFLDAQDPIRFLTDATAISFSDEDDSFRTSKHTTDEILLCIKDLKVLGKSDFKRLLKWRTKLLEERAAAEADDKEDDSMQVEAVPEVVKTEEELQEERDASLREELAQARVAAAAKKKREKKKDREKKAKERVRAAMGMDLNAIEIGDDDQVFNLKDLKMSKAKVDAIMNAGEVEEDEQAVEEEEEESSDDDDDDDLKYEEELEKQMDSMYEQYLSTKDEKTLNKRAVKRTKVAKRALASAALVKDAAMYDGDSKAYANLLEAEKSSDESEDDDEDEKLVVTPAVKEPESAVAARWFSGNPLFAEVEESVTNTQGDDDDDMLDSSDSEDEGPLPEMPKTDKVLRKERREKAKERKERRAEKKQQKEDAEFPVEVVENNELLDEIDELEKRPDDNSPADKAELEALEKRKQLIAAGMGSTFTSKTQEKAGFEVVQEEVFDDRKYDTDNEDYDEEDRARTLALGTMMIRKSKAKEMIDSSYNRYAWNDPEELPDWFMDDEEKNYRPQVPIPKKLMEQMKEKFLAMATKPVKKVAEARSRKQKQQMKKLKAAKKKATDIANMPDMSNREKLKSIEKTMKGAKLQKQSKVYVVSTRGGRKDSKDGKKGAKGRVKLVDARMKSDKRGMEKKKRKGRKGGSK